MMESRVRRCAKKGAVWGLAAAIQLLSSRGGAQTILLELRNGDRLTGTVVSEDSRNVTLQTRWKGKVVIPRSEIQQRTLPPESGATAPSAKTPSSAPESTHRPELTSDPARRLEELLALYVSDKISPEQYHEERVKLLASGRIAPSSVKPPIPAAALAKSASTAGVSASANAPGAPQPKPPSTLHGEVQFGMEAGLNSSKYETYTGRLNVSYVKDRFRNVFDYSATYGKANEVLSANRMDGSWRLDFDLKHRMFAYMSTAAGYDQIRKVDLYDRIGPGFGYKISTRTNFVMNGTFGSTYQDYYYTDEPSRHNVFLSFGEDLTWTFLSKITWIEKLEFMPRPERFDEYRLRFESTLRYPLSKNLSLNFNVVDFYDTSPAQGVSNNDLQIRSTLGIKF